MRAGIKESDCLVGWIVDVLIPLLTSTITSQEFRELQDYFAPVCHSDGELPTNSIPSRQHQSICSWSWRSEPGRCLILKDM